MKRKIMITAAALAAVAAIVAFMPAGRELLLSAAKWAESAPEFAWPLFLLSLAVAVVAMVPGWPFMVAGGYLFGALAGGLLAFIANLVGSIAAFLLAKTYARQWIKDRIDHSPRFSGFDKAVSRNGFSSVMFARLAMLPNNILNYACGVTGMRLRDFILGTSVGCLPVLVANVLIGVSTKDLFTTVEDGGLEKQQLPLELVGAIIAAAALIVFLAKRFGPRLANPESGATREEGELGSER
ncbi:MAG: TVP38/TMEM64 family protein [Gammaproteobacteria bacterium]|nr:TVP38/TMEM64 family protein [Gammaproteobacteria bacterium]